MLKRVVQHQKDQLVTLPGGGFRWFSLNTTIKPFDNINVRKAILAGFDRDAALQGARRHVRRRRSRRTSSRRASRASRRPAATRAPGFDFLANPQGDMAVAEKYMKAAGYPRASTTGTTVADGRRERRPGQGQAEVAEAQLEKLGFKIRLRTVPQDAMYTKCCQRPRQEGRGLPDRGLVQGLQRPADDARADVQGRTSSPDGGNNNWPQLDDPKINKAMDDAALLEGNRARTGVGRRSTR